MLKSKLVALGVHAQRNSAAALHAIVYRVSETDLCMNEALKNMMSNQARFWMPMVKTT